MQHIQHEQYLMLCAIAMANSTLENTSIISFDLPNEIKPNEIGKGCPG